MIKFNRKIIELVIQQSYNLIPNFVTAGIYFEFNQSRPGLRTFVTATVRDF